MSGLTKWSESLFVVFEAQGVLSVTDLVNKW